MEMRIDGNLSVHQRTTRFCSDVEIKSKLSEVENSEVLKLSESESSEIL
ncbi:hypothetical protein T06_6686 [Trichinella sp. T6]|nr:hypothetical protein T06_6686 [Trichinella sp. T6]